MERFVSLDEASFMLSFVQNVFVAFVNSNQIHSTNDKLRVNEMQRGSHLSVAQFQFRSRNHTTLLPAECGAEH
jgi:hypothetical protein